MIGSNSPVKFGLDVPNGGEFADARKLAQLAAKAERAGWDGFFVMDHLIRRPPWKPMVDPWIALTAVALATDNIILGPMITPLARRRPAVVARQTATLDCLSNGRLRLGVGLGAPDDEFTRFGESADQIGRAQMLDEAIEMLRLLWSGEEVNFSGNYFQADGVKFSPRPTNDHIPIWVGGAWPGSAPFRRAARNDGVWPIAKGGGYLSVDGFADCVLEVERLRDRAGNGLGQHFDYCFTSSSPAGEDAETTDKVGRLSSLGMTWWIEPLDDPEISFEQHVDRVQAGPPTH